MSLDGQDMQLSSWPPALIKDPWSTFLSADYILHLSQVSIQWVLFSLSLCSPCFPSNVEFSRKLCLCWNICVLKDSTFYRGPEVTALLEWAKWFLYMILFRDFYFSTKSTTTIAHYSISILQQQSFMACQHCIELHEAGEVEHRKGTCSKLAIVLLTF